VTRIEGRGAACITIAFVVLFAVRTSTAELKPATVAAFERYVRATEARIAAEVQSDQRFLHVDGLPDQVRRARLGELAKGRLVIERLRTEEDGKPLEAQDGIIHHWLGVAFVPGGTVAGAVALLQDYNRHAEIYQPAIAQSRVLEHNGDTFRVFLRFFMKKVISVTVNSEHVARFTGVNAGRASSQIVSTRVQEVRNAGTRSEQELPVGNDGGYLWRINSYWRFLERDAGVYIQCESVSLSRDIPFGLGWVVGPFVTSIPQESLAFTLETTRKALAGRK
jgi:hypothetical protein